MPTTPDPRSAGRPVASSITTALGGAVNTAVAVGSAPGIVIEIANGPPSLAPIMSMITALPQRCWNAFLWSAESVAPVETMRCTDERSYERPAASAASSAATIGRANASPTIDSCVT